MLRDCDNDAVIGFESLDFQLREGIPHSRSTFPVLTSFLQARGPRDFGWMDCKKVNSAALCMVNISRSSLTGFKPPECHAITQVVEIQRFFWRNYASLANDSNREMQYQIHGYHSWDLLTSTDPPSDLCFSPSVIFQILDWTKYRQTWIIAPLLWLFSLSLKLISMPRHTTQESFSLRQS
jgi:hypothetical protein